MNIDIWEQRILSYFEGDLSPTDVRQLMDKVHSDSTIYDIYRQYEQIYCDISELPVMSHDTDNRFEAFLQKEIAELKTESNKKTKIVPINYLKYTVGIAALFVLTFISITNYQQHKAVQASITHLHQNINTIRDDQSPTERIKAIMVSTNHDNTDAADPIIEVLIDVLQHDKSSNVRLAAVESLGRYIDIADVRVALIERLTKEEDGFVNLAIVNALGKTRSAEAKSALEKVSQDLSLERYIIDEAHAQLIRSQKEEI